jgi:hypothetical protein
MGRKSNDQPEDGYALTQTGDDKPVKTRRAEKVPQLSNSRANGLI